MSLRFQWLSVVGAPFLLFLVSALAWCADSPRPNSEEEPSTVQLGKKIDNLSLSDGTGKTLSLYDIKPNKAVVVFFLSFQCPIANAYRPMMIKLQEEYSKKGVAFVGICPTESDPAQLAKLVKEHSLPFPVFKDDKLVAANAIAAEITPEAFLLDDGFILRYRGRIDNSWDAPLVKGTKFITSDLKDALDELLAGKRITKPATVAIGCSIDRPSESNPGSIAVTYHRDVLPVLQKNCQSCHCSGGSGPFSLTTYQQASRWGRLMKKFTAEKKMPPWQASAGGPFHGEMKLDRKEIETIASWVSLGCHEGDAKDAPAPARQKSLAHQDGWQLGKPDLVLEVSDHFVLAASGADDMARVFPLKSKQYVNKRLAAVEILPSNKRIVRSASVFLSGGGKGEKPKERPSRSRGKDSTVDSGPGYGSLSGPGFVPAGLVGTYEPGQPLRRLPPGSAYMLGGGEGEPTLVLQVHYHRSGKIEKDRTKVGLYFAKESDSKSYQGLVMTANAAVIPPAAADHRFIGKLTLDQDCEIHSVMPCLSFLGKAIKVKMTPPGDVEQTLVAIDAWDPHWQQTYHLRQPIKVKAGTRFTVEAHFNNTIDNVYNPFRPPRSMRLGHGLSEERCAVYLGVTSARPFSGSLVLSDGTTPTKGKKAKQ